MIGALQAAFINLTRSQAAPLLFVLHFVYGELTAQYIVLPTCVTSASLFSTNLEKGAGMRPWRLGLFRDLSLGHPALDIDTQRSQR